MYKRILSILLVILMSLSLFPLSVSAVGSNVVVTYDNGKVKIEGTGFASGANYTIRVVDTENSSIKAMGQIMASNGDGSFSASITTGLLETPSDYMVYVNNADGTLAASAPLDAAAMEGSVTATYTSGVVTVEGTGFTSGTSYTVRVVNTKNSSVKALGQATASGQRGEFSAYITTGALEVLSDYVVYINNPNGMLVGCDTSIAAENDDPEITISGTVVSTVLTATVDTETGIVAANIPENTIDGLIEKANELEAAHKKAVIEINIELEASTNDATITIPSDAFKRISENADADVRLSTELWSITFDHKAVNIIGQASLEQEDLRLLIKKVENDSLSQKAKAKVGNRPVYDFSLLAGNREITSFGGGEVQISIPYTLEPGEKQHSIVIYYINEGKLKTVMGSYDPKSKTVNFTTKHFSSMQWDIMK